MARESSMHVKEAYIDHNIQSLEDLCARHDEEAYIREQRQFLLNFDQSRKSHIYRQSKSSRHKKLASHSCGGTRPPPKSIINCQLRIRDLQYIMYQLLCIVQLLQHEDNVCYHRTSCASDVNEILLLDTRHCMLTTNQSL